MTWYKKILSNFFKQFKKLLNRTHENSIQRIESDKVIVNPIQDMIDQNRILLFMEGTPDFPKTDASAEIASTLRIIGYTFSYVDVLEHPDSLIYLSEMTNSDKTPQLWLKGEWLGDSDVVMQMSESGELKKRILEPFYPPIHEVLLPPPVVAPDTNLNDDEGWIQIIWDWADMFAIEKEVIPRDKKQVIEMSHLFINRSTGIVSRKITYIPEEIANLKQLKTLELMDLFSNIPDIIDNFTELSKVVLQNNNLVKLPDSIGNLKKLTRFDIRFNEINEIPQWIGNLRHLESFECAYNEINTLPNSMSKLSQLKVLNLLKNKIRHLPSWIGELRSLETLMLRENQLCDLPDSIGNLTQLNRLALDQNQIHQLPDSIGNLSQLNSLELESNKISKLPGSIGNLGKLEYLVLYDNKLTELPDSIGNLRSLKEIHLNCNKLENLPDGITKLEGVWINLYGNPLSKLSPKVEDFLRSGNVAVDGWESKDS